LVLLAGVLELITYDPDVQADLKLLELFMRWVVRLKDEEGYELASTNRLFCDGKDCQICDERLW
jgi:hypothetical protein